MMITKKRCRFNIKTLPMALVALLLGTGCQAFSYEEAYGMTDVDLVEVKTVPPSKVLVAEGDGQYFDRANNLFMRLFNYIKDNDVAMTVPVEARVEKARMVFYVGTKDSVKNLKDNSQVKVVDKPERTVVSIGVRGSYTEKNFVEARDRLEEWLYGQDGYESTGKPYAVFWNGPFVPGFMKRFEVHIPVQRIERETLANADKVVKI